MPTMPPHRCASCSKLVVGRCGCQGTNTSATHRGYTSARWRRVRLEQLRCQPFCTQCGDVACDVDHVIPHTGPDDPRFWDRTNLNSLCKPCHSRKTATRDSGFARRTGT